MGQLSPRVFLWGARAAYVGPGLDLAPHHNAAATIAISAERPFEYSVLEGPVETALETLVVIPPNTQHHLRAYDSVAFLYLDASGDDYRVLSTNDDARLRVAAARSAIHAALEPGPTSPGDHIRNILSALGVVTREDVDPRLVEVVRGLARQPQEFSSVAIAADRAGLSISRFQHMFRAAMGVPFRRYRLWSRMSQVAQVLSGGGNLTEAALHAGFSSSAHFSASFRTMFGLSPTQLLASGVELCIDQDLG